MSLSQGNVVVSRHPIHTSHQPLSDNPLPGELSYRVCVFHLLDLRGTLQPSTPSFDWQILKNGSGPRLCKSQVSRMLHKGHLSPEGTRSKQTTWHFRRPDRSELVGQVKTKGWMKRPWRSLGYAPAILYLHGPSNNPGETSSWLHRVAWSLEGSQDLLAIQPGCK